MIRTCIAISLAALATLAHADVCVLTPGSSCTISMPAGTTPVPTPPSPPPPVPPPPPPGPIPQPGWDGVCKAMVASPGGGTMVVNLPTVVRAVNWANPARLDIAMQPDTVVVVEMTTGSLDSAVNSLPRISAAEYGGSPPSARIATLSPTPCDFSTQPRFGANIAGNSVTAVFAVGNGSGLGYYPVIPTNTKWYLNIKNDPGASCTSSGDCRIFVDLLKGAL